VAIIVVVSHEQGARALAEKICALGIRVMGIYSHEPYRDGVRYMPEPMMAELREKYKLVGNGQDSPVKDFG